MRERERKEETRERRSGRGEKGGESDHYNDMFFSNTIVAFTVINANIKTVPLIEVASSASLGSWSALENATTVESLPSCAL